MPTIIHDSGHGLEVGTEVEFLARIGTLDFYTIKGNPITVAIPPSDLSFPNGAQL